MGLYCKSMAAGFVGITAALGGICMRATETAPTAGLYLMIAGVALAAIGAIGACCANRPQDPSRAPGDGLRQVVVETSTSQSRSRSVSLSVLNPAPSPIMPTITLPNVPHS